MLYDLERSLVRYLATRFSVRQHYSTCRTRRAHKPAVDPAKLEPSPRNVGRDRFPHFAWRTLPIMQRESVARPFPAGARAGGSMQMGVRTLGRRHPLGGGPGPRRRRLRLRAQGTGADARAVHRRRPAGLRGAAAPQPRPPPLQRALLLGGHLLHRRPVRAVRPGRGPAVLQHRGEPATSSARSAPCCPTPWCRRPTAPPSP